MTDIFTPLIAFSGEKLNLIQINLDPSLSSTNSTNPFGEGSKGNQKLRNVRSRNKDNTIKISSKSKKKKLTTHLHKKTKRNKNSKNFSKNNKDNKMSGKYKMIFKIFNEFKSSSPLFKEYPQFIYIEKNVKNNLYSSLNDLATEIRNVFSQIFYSCSDSNKYDITLSLCDLFEKIYKDYDNKIFIKESKYLTEVINKLKKELRQTESFKNSDNNINIHGSYFKASNKNKFKFHLNDSDSEMDSDMSIKKYKNEIGNKIKKLSKEQKRGILSVISMNCVDKNNDSNVMKLDVNKMPFSQLKQLEKYVNKCIKDNIKINNNLSIISDNKNDLLKLQKNDLSKSRTVLFDEDKEIDILKNDDLSSCLSDDEDDEDDDE